MQDVGRRSQKCGYYRGLVDFWATACAKLTHFVPVTSFSVDVLSWTTDTEHC